MQINSQNPRLPTVKAVYCCESGAILTCQKPLLKAIVEKCTAPTMISRASWICGNGYEPFLVCMFRQWKSSISWSETHSSSSSGGGMHLNHSLKGSLLFMWISCSIALIHPGSLLFNTKMSWKVRTSSLMVAAFLGDQLLRPSRFSFSRSLSWCVETDIGSC